MEGHPDATVVLYFRENPGTHYTGGCLGPMARLDRCGITRLPPGFDLRTVQPVASRYTDNAIRPTTGPRSRSTRVSYKFLARPEMKQARKHVRDARDFNNIEIRAVIKFLFHTRQGAEGNSRHSHRNISLFLSWSG